MQLNKIDLDLVVFLYGFKCNLSCRDCLSSSDILDHTTYDPSLENIIESIDNVAKYVSNVNHMVSLIGGEPLLYWDRIKTLARHIRKRFPNATIGLSTNGLLLHKYKDEVIELLMELKNCKIDVSNHMHDFPDDKAAIVSKRNLEYFLSDPRFYKIHEYHYDIPNYKADIHLRNKTLEFITQYKRTKDGTLKPFASGNPSESFARGCTGRICSTVINNKLYKCTRLATLPMVLEQKNLLDDPDWKKYQGYKHVDLSKEVTQEELDRFKENEGKYIDECDICPEKRVLTPRTKENVLKR